MYSVKLKFRPSANPLKEGSLVYQVICNRVVRRIKSRYRIFNDEWDSASSQIVLPTSSSAERHGVLCSIRTHTRWELSRLEKALGEMERGGDFSEVEGKLRQLLCISGFSTSVYNFINAQIIYKRQMGKIRTSETYQATLNSFMQFRCGIDLTFDMIDSELIELYEMDMRERGLSRNTTSFYMRILRTQYRLAVEHGLTQDRRPFKRVYCGIDKTVKRSLSFGEIKRIKELDLSGLPVCDFARDMFIFSFCMRGMSFVDMSYLRKSDLRNGYITYRRKKTGQLLTIEWTGQMQAIVDKYGDSETQYLLPIIRKEDGTERRQYQNQMLKVNRKLKKIAGMVNISVPLTLYYSRHSWATIARGKDVPLSVISEGLGHDSEATTQIYLDSIKSSEVDKANRKILKGL